MKYPVRRHLPPPNKNVTPPLQGDGVHPRPHECTYNLPHKFSPPPIFFSPRGCICTHCTLWLRLWLAVNVLLTAGRANRAPVNPVAGFERPGAGKRGETERRKSKEMKETEGTGENTPALRYKLLIPALLTCHQPCSSGLHCLLLSASLSSVTLSLLDLLRHDTQLYYDTFAAEQLNSWIAKYSSIT